MIHVPFPVLGIDPSSSYTGIALLDASGVRYVAGVRMFSGKPMRSARERTIPAVREACAIARPQLVVVEKPPGTARKDTNHARQGDIGWKVGVAGALAIAELVLDGTPVVFVEVGPWRKTMLEVAARHGLVIQKPTRGNVSRASTSASKPAGVNRDGRGFIQTYTRCEHVARFEGFKALVNGPDSCAVCSTGAKKLNAAELVTRAWKKAAVDICDHLYPGALDPVVGAAAKRARGPKERHRYAGVSDAAESLMIALHGRTLSLEGQ